MKYNTKLNGVYRASINPSQVRRYGGREIFYLVVFKAGASIQGISGLDKDFNGGLAYFPSSGFTNNPDWDFEPANEFEIKWVKQCIIKGDFMERESIIVNSEPIIFI